MAFDGRMRYAAPSFARNPAMPSQLLPFQATVDVAPGAEPWRLRLSQAFNEAVFFGSNQPPSEALSMHVRKLMQICNGEAGAVNEKEEVLALLMAMAFDLEYLALCISGDAICLDRWRGFADGMKMLAGNIHAILDGRAGPVSLLVQERLQEAEFRWRTRYGDPANAPRGEVYVDYRGLPEAISLPHRHASMGRYIDAPPLAAGAGAANDDTTTAEKASAPGAGPLEAGSVRNAPSPYPQPTAGAQPGQHG